MFVFLQLVTRSAAQEGLNETAVTFGLLLSVSPVSLLLVLLALPPVVAETIARDKQLGMDELRASLPITPGLYLAGKVLGVWACVAMMIFTVATLLWIAAIFTLGSVELVAYVRVWLTAIIPAGLYVSALTVLLASREPNRKRATMLGSLIAIYCLLTIPFIQSDVEGWRQAFLPSAWFTLVMRAAFQYVANSTTLPVEMVQFAIVSDEFVQRTMLAMMAQLLVVWTAVWGWWRWRSAW
jgi:hypothetical protein